MNVQRAAAATPLVAAEHHHFCVAERWLVYDAVTMAVQASHPLDGAILAQAQAAPSTARELAAGDDGRRKRVKILTAAGLLRPVGALPPALAPVAAAKPTFCSFMINVSQRCNLTCDYCYVHEGDFDFDVKPRARLERELCDTVAARIFTMFPGFKTYGMHFYGGEPLMNFKGIRRIVEDAVPLAREAGVDLEFFITTNGTLITDEVADFMDQHGFTVYLSIDGNKETHDSVRTYRNGKGSYDDVRAGMQSLAQRDHVHLIGSSVIRDGLDLPDAMAMLSACGAKQCKAERVRLPEGEAMALKGAALTRYLQDVHGLAEHYIEHLERHEKPADYRLSAKILQLLMRNRRDHFCPAGERMFGIDAEGEIYPCSLHVGRDAQRLGSLGGGVDGARVKDFRKRFSIAGQAHCQTCWNRHLCGGGCSAMVDRFGEEDCAIIMAESEAAMAVYMRFAGDPMYLIGLVSPSLAAWANGGEFTP